MMDMPKGNEEKVNSATLKLINELVKAPMDGQQVVGFLKHAMQGDVMGSLMNGLLHVSELTVYAEDTAKKHLADLLAQGFSKDECTFVLDCASKSYTTYLITHYRIITHAICALKEKGVFNNRCKVAELCKALVSGKKLKESQVKFLAQIQKELAKQKSLTDNTLLRVSNIMGVDTSYLNGFTSDQEQLDAMLLTFVAVMFVNNTIDFWELVNMAPVRKNKK